MSHRIRFFSILSISLLFFGSLLAGCGSPSSSSATTLSMWTWKPNDIPGLQAVANDFKAQTGITVNISAFTPDANYRTKVTTAAQSGELPDILSYWSGAQFDLAADGLLVNLMGKVDSTWQNTFLSGTFSSTSIYTASAQAACQAAGSQCEHANLQVGQIYSVPYLAGAAGFVYANKSLLQQAGLSVQAPQTAEEWLTMMETVKAKTGVAGLVTGVKNPNVLDFWLFRPLLMTSCGESTYDAIYNGKDSFTNPCALRVFNWIDSISTNNLWLPGILQTDIDPGDLAFAQGKAAFDIGGTYTLSSLTADGMSASDVITFPIPALQGSVYSSLKLGASALIDAAITTSSKHQAQALQFLKFLTSTTEMAVFAKASNDMPAAQVPADPSKVGPVVASMVSGFSADSPFNTSQAQPQSDPQSVLETGLQQFITGEITPSALAQKVNAANQAAWHKNGS